MELPQLRRAQPELAAGDAISLEVSGLAQMIEVASQAVDEL